MSRFAGAFGDERSGALRPAFFLLLAALYLYAFPYFDRLRSANEMPRILMTQQIVDRGVLWLDERRGDMASQLDTSWGPDGHLYPNKAPGPSFLAIPAYALCKLLGATSLRACTWAFRVTAVTLPALLFLPFFYRLTRRFSRDERARRAALCAYALASPALPYSLLFFSHVPAATYAGLGFFCAVWLARFEARRPWLSAAGAGFFTALSLAMDYQAAIAAVFIAFYFVSAAPRPLVHLPLAIAGALPPLAGLAAYHAAAFGSPWKTGYSYSVDTVTRKGFMGIVGPSAESMYSTTFLPANGIVVLAPWVLLALVGLAAGLATSANRRRFGLEALCCGFIALAYVLFVGSLDPYMARGGWCVGPRYLTVSLPFVAWLAAAGFAAADRFVVSAVAARAAVVAAGTIFVVAATTYPHWPDGLANPLYELAFRLVFHGYAVHSLGTALGLSGVAATLPMYLLALGVALYLLRREPGRRGVAVLTAAVVVGAAVVAAHRLFPLTGAYAQQAWAFITSTWEPR